MFSENVHSYRPSLFKRFVINDVHRRKSGLVEPEN